MRYPVQHKQRTRERIVRAAARRFRNRGTEGAAISELMRDLHLTHGGFYRHFGSKEGLVVDAFAAALKESGDRTFTAIEKAPPGGEIQALIDAYLDPKHCDDIAGGCPVAALACEIARRPKGSRGPFLEALRAHIRRIEQFMPGATVEARRQKTIALFTGMAGTLMVARAFTDERDRRTILEGARKFYSAAIQG
ncbi:MAG TPA: TetR/AcrR family transcriptional regulator [Vicinamibacterales bacterium]|jgi:TetR/AcrR family transcriptional repressor of nem operon